MLFGRRGSEVRQSSIDEPAEDQLEHQWQTLMDIRCKLKEYGNGENTGLESKAWAAPENEGATEDLVSLQSSSQEKALVSSWATGRLLTFFHNKPGYKFKVRLVVKFHKLWLFWLT